MHRKEATVAGRVDGRLDGAGYRHSGQLRGTASCAEPQDSRCRRVLVSFETRGVLFDPADASRVGRVEQEGIGSLLLVGDAAHWAALGSTGPSCVHSASLHPIRSDKVPKT